MGNKQECANETQVTSNKSTNNVSSPSSKYKMTHKTKRIGARNTKPMNKSMISTKTKPTKPTKPIKPKKSFDSDINNKKSSISTTSCSPLSTARTTPHRQSRKHQHYALHALSLQPKYNNNHHSISPHPPITRRNTSNAVIPIITPSPSASPYSAIHRNITPNTHLILPNLPNLANLPIPKKSSFSSLHLPVINKSRSRSGSWSSMSNPYSKYSKSSSNTNKSNKSNNTSSTPWILYTDKIISKYHPKTLTTAHLQHEIMVSEPSSSPSQSLCSVEHNEYHQYIQQKISIQQSSTPTFDENEDGVAVDI